MLWFKKEKRRYPAVFYEWITEFERIGTAFLSEQDAKLLSEGILKDKKYCIENFEKELSAFLEKQLRAFFDQYSTVVRRYTEEGDFEYLILVVRRHYVQYRRLFFFEAWDFVGEAYKRDLSRTLRDKINTYHHDLVSYFDKLAVYADSMYEVSLSIKRLIEV